ncbi:MAG: hypothetical protein LC798_13590 [Chloroflexi bacterium]|nr:hypothetical protein [Chloroflexota bacterium]
MKVRVTRGTIERAKMIRFGGGPLRRDLDRLEVAALCSLAEAVLDAAPALRDGANQCLMHAGGLRAFVNAVPRGGVMVHYDSETGQRNMTDDEIRAAIDEHQRNAEQLFGILALLDSKEGE